MKNLIRSMCCKTEILRLGPQNDIATRSLDRRTQKWLDALIKSEHDIIICILDGSIQCSWCLHINTLNRIQQVNGILS